MARSIDFTRDDLAAAIKIAKSKVEQGSAWYRSIERAERNLAAGRFMFDGQIVKLQSATSNKVYTLDTAEPIVCDRACKDTTGKCWHVTAARLIVRAAERAQLRQAVQQQPVKDAGRVLDAERQHRQSFTVQPGKLAISSGRDYAAIQAAADECY